MKSFLPPQTISVYRLLLTGKSMTVKEIGKKLEILPHSVYRSIKILEQLGYLERAGRYPTYFQAVPIFPATELFQLTARDWFLRTFHLGIGQSKNLGSDLQFDIAFIRNREDLLNHSNQDLEMAKTEVELIVSGLEVPAETILENKRAIDRGVAIKILVQDLGSHNQEMLQNWKRLGVEVKVCPTIEARIIIFDRQIVYLTSYDKDSPSDGIGVRIRYPPVAKLMYELFKNRWNSAVQL